MGSIPSAHGVDHLAFTVPRLRDAVAFFRDALGAELRYELGPVHDPRGQWMSRQLGVHERAVAHVAMLGLGPVTNVELFEYETPGGQAPPPRNGDWGSLHLGFAVADMDAAASYLERIEGVHLLGASGRIPEAPDSGSRFAYFETPTGIPVQIREAPQDGSVPPDAPHPGIPTAHRVDHFGLTVPHLPTAERFFCERLGAELVHRLDPRWLDAAAMARRGVPAAGIVQQSRLRVGPTIDIELCQFELPGQRQAVPSNSDHGGHHLAFAVGDVDQAAGYLGALREIEPLGTPQTEQDGAIAGTRWQHFRTSWGLHVEVIDMPPGVPLHRPATAAQFEFGAAVPG